MAFPRPAAVGLAVGLSVTGTLYHWSQSAPDVRPGLLPTVERGFEDALTHQWDQVKKIWTKEPQPGLDRSQILLDATKHTSEMWTYLGSGLEIDPSKPTSGMSSGLGVASEAGAAKSIGTFGAASGFGRYAVLDTNNHVVGIKFSLIPVDDAIPIPPDVFVQIGWDYVPITGKFAAPDWFNLDSPLGDATMLSKQDLLGSVAKATQGHQPLSTLLQPPHK